MSKELAVGVIAGGAWTLVNLWCLSRALQAWLRIPVSKGRSIAWFVVKFPLLYAVAVALLMRSSVCSIGFGIGFTVVLICAMIGSVIVTSRAIQSAPSHGG